MSVINKFEKMEIYCDEKCNDYIAELDVLGLDYYIGPYEEIKKNNTTIPIRIIYVITDDEKACATVEELKRTRNNIYKSKPMNKKTKYVLTYVQLYKDDEYHLYSNEQEHIAEFDSVYEAEKAFWIRMSSENIFRPFALIVQVCDAEVLGDGSTSVVYSYAIEFSEDENYLMDENEYEQMN